MVEPHSSNFRVITTNILGVRIFRKFTVPLDNFEGTGGAVFTSFQKLLIVNAMAMTA